MAMKFKNNAATTLASSINASDTSLTVLTGQGALFPTIVNSSDYFYCTLANTSGIVEIIKVTGRTGDNFTTIVRAQDNTSAVSWNAGDKVELRLVAACLNDIPKLDEPWTINSSPGTNGQVLTSLVQFHLQFGPLFLSQFLLYLVAQEQSHSQVLMFLRHWGILHMLRQIHLVISHLLEVVHMLLMQEH